MPQPALRADRARKLRLRTSAKDKRYASFNQHHPITRRFQPHAPSSPSSSTETLISSVHKLALFTVRYYGEVMDALQFTNPFQPYLLAGERVLWSGRPKQGIAFRPIDGFLIPFSILWCGFVVAMFATAASQTGSPSIILLLFMLFGLYFLVGRFIHDSVIRRRTSYALTDQRALFRCGSKTSSLDLSHLPKLELQERSDGTGTIEFQDTGSQLTTGSAD